jgi:hypothetical protein
MMRGDNQFQKYNKKECECFMSRVTLILLGFGFGCLLGIPPTFLKRASVTLYRVYSGICLSIVALVLAFRYTQNVVPIDLHGAIIYKELLFFLGVAFGGFYVPFVTAYGFSLWVISQLVRS